MKNHLYCAAPVCLILLELWGTLAAQCQWNEGCVCPLCPSGQEPTSACVEAEAPGETESCQICPAGSFSDTHDTKPCRPHTSCRELNRWILTAPTSQSDAVCGVCLPGFHPAATRKTSTLHTCVSKPYTRRRRNVVKGTPSRSGVGGANSTSVNSPEEKSTEYAVFALVPIFCVMGLLGILICNLLKKKGYRCNAEKDAVDEESATPQKEGNLCPYVIDDPNEDTISVLVRLITEKKENAAALEELLLEHENKQMAMTKSSSIKFPALPPFSQFRSLPRLCTHQHHLHTINGLASLSGLCCSRCNQKKWPELLLPADTHKNPSKLVKSPLPGDVTVLSVGRFQVAQIPEMKSASKEVTRPESSDTDSVDSGHTGSVEERSLLGMSSSSISTSSKTDRR